MIRGFIALFLTVFIPCVGMTSSFSGGSASFVTKASRHPNIIFIMVDELGREQYQQLLSPYANSVGDVSFDATAAPLGQSYEVRPSSHWPNLNKLLLNGINFTGMWSGSFCAATREMLQRGNNFTLNVSESGPNLGQAAPMRQIQDITGDAYAIAHWGKGLLGSSSPANDCTMPGCFPSIPSAGGNGFGWVDTLPQWSGLASPGPVPVNETALWTIGGTQIMWRDEAAFVQIEQYIESLYDSKTPAQSNWFENQTGNPFILALSPHSIHNGGSYNCTQERTANATGRKYVYPTSGQEAAFTTLPFPTGNSALKGPTPNYDAAEFAILYAGGADSIPAYKPWFDCQMTQLKWLDDYLGTLIGWLGPHGLENTLIIFTGDNGSAGDLYSNRTGAFIPNAPTVQPTPATTLIGASAPANSRSGFGKNANTGTGYNVPFVVAYGSIPKRLRNTSSAARLNFADVAETIVQLVAPRAAQYFPNTVNPGTHDGSGRNFTPLIYGTASDQDSLFGITIVGDLNIYGCDASLVFCPDEGRPWQAQASMDPDASGDIYILSKNPNSGQTISGNPSSPQRPISCDYVQNFSAANYSDNLRGDIGSNAELLAAVCAMQSAIEEAWPATVANPTVSYQEPATCLPTYASLCP